MRRATITLLSVAAMLLPVLSTLGHQDRELAGALEDQEITVTGHDERDATLHIEAAVGVVLSQCPECVLDKRQSGADRRAKPVLALASPRRGLVPEVSVRRSFADSECAPARAPPLA